MGAAEHGGEGDALARILRDRREAIAAAWAEALREEGLGGAPAGPSLRDHLPGLLDELADAVAGAPGPREATSGPLGARLAQGASLADVLAELAVLRRVIGRLLQPPPRRGDGMLRLHEALDRLVGHAAAWAAGSRERTLRALDRITGMVVEAADLGPAAVALAAALREAAPAVDEVTLLLREGDTLVVAARTGLVPAPEETGRLAVGEGFAGTIAATGAPLELAAPSDAGGRPTTQGGNLRALYGVPIRRQGEVLGVAHMGSRSLARFSDEDKLVFRTMVDRVAITLAERDLRRAVAREHEAAMEGRRQLQTILDVLPVGVFVADGFGRVLAHNAAARTIWGGPLPPVIGPSEYGRFVTYRVADGKLLPPEEWGLRRALEGETVVDQELDIVRFDGRCGSILATSVPMRDESGRLVGAVVVNVDISERRRAERDRDFLATVGRALAESLDFDTTLRRLAELAVPRLAEWCAIDVAEPEGLRRVAVAGEGPTPGLADGPFAAGRGEAPAAAAEATARAIASGQPLFAAEATPERLRALLPEGGEGLAELHRLGVRSFMAVPLVARGRPLGAMLFALGATARRYAPADLDLAREVAVRAALAVDNARLYRDAREAIRARDDLWAVASHELKNPLAALLLLLQGAKRAVKRGEPVALERLDRATGQVRRLTALVGDLLDSTRAQSGRLELHVERMDLAGAALEAVERHRPEAKLAGVALDFEARARPIGHWDPGRLDQVLTNLIGNALKYGGGARVEVAVDAADGEAVLAVRDRGPGIPPEDQARIFEPFERAKETGRKQGLGLGLYIVRRIVEAHGGRIEVVSAPGAGATFVVRLPREAPGDTPGANA